MTQAPEIEEAVVVGADWRECSRCQRLYDHARLTVWDRHAHAVKAFPDNTCRLCTLEILNGQPA